MARWIIMLASQHRTVKGGPLHSDTVEHTGWLELRDGDLVVSERPFAPPFIGYGRGAWIKFEKKEA